MGLFGGLKYSLEKYKNTKEKLNKAEDVKSGLENSVGRSSNLSKESLKYNQLNNAEDKVNSLKKELDSIYNAGHTEGAKLNEDYNRKVESLSSAMVDLMNFRINELGMSKDKVKNLMIEESEKIIQSLNN